MAISPSKLDEGNSGGAYLPAIREVLVHWLKRPGGFVQNCRGEPQWLMGRSGD